MKKFSPQIYLVYNIQTYVALPPLPPLPSFKYSSFPIPSRERNKDKEREREKRLIISQCLNSITCKHTVAMLAPPWNNFSEVRIKFSFHVSCFLVTYSFVGRFDVRTVIVSLLLSIYTLSLISLIMYIFFHLSFHSIFFAYFFFVILIVFIFVKFSIILTIFIYVVG